MSVSPVIDTHANGHGDVFARDLGAMIVHVQRETGLAHRTFVFRSWQVHVARTMASGRTWAVVVFAVVSWVFLAAQAIRVPLLSTRITKMEQEALRVDTLQQTLKDLQVRYEQVQSMLSRPAQVRAPSTRAPSTRAPSTRAPSTRAPSTRAPGR